MVTWPVLKTYAARSAIANQLEQGQESSTPIRSGQKVLCSNQIKASIFCSNQIRASVLCSNQIRGQGFFSSNQIRAHGTSPSPSPTKIIYTIRFIKYMFRILLDGFRVHGCKGIQYTVQKHSEDFLITSENFINQLSCTSCIPNRFLKHTKFDGFFLRTV
jgi:hypothetical protein